MYKHAHTAKMTRTRTQSASWRLPDVRWVVALLGLVACLTSTASAGDVCEAYTRVYLLKHVPHYSLMRAHIQVQVKLINTDHFIEYDKIEEYNQQYVMHLYTDGKMHTILQLGYYYGWEHKERCADDPSFLQRYDDLHLFHYSQLLRLHPDQYIGDNETVRDLPVEHWRHCPLGNYSLDVYFNKRGENAFQNSKQPLRIIEKSVSKQVIYDIVILSRDVATVTYLPQAADVESCTKTGDTHVTLPPQSDSYSATVVMAFARQKYATTRQHFYDHETKLASSNMLILPGHDFMRRFGHGYVSIVHDFGNDLQYVIDVDQGNCTVESLPRSASTYPFSGPWDPAAVNTPGLFDLSAFNLTTRYAYQTSIRDVGVDVWVGTRVDWPKRSVNTTVKVFYSDIHWATSGLKLEDTFLRDRILRRYTSGLEPIENMRLLGLSYHTTDNETSYGQEIPDFTHVYDYRTGAPDFSVFDVSACYNTRHIKRLTFSVRACFRVLLRHDPGLFEAAVRKFVVDKCGITPIRLSNVEVVASARDHVDVHIQLLDLPPLKGNVESRSSVSLEDAVWRLGLAIDKQKDIGITVTYPEGTTRVVVIPGSLRTDDMSTRSYETGHTGGTLAAIGVAMLFVGMILAPAAAYVIWKKNISIPYFIQ